MEEAEADSEPLAEPELARGTEKHSNSKQRRMRRQRAASRLCQGQHTIGPPPLPGRDALYRIAMEKRLELWRSLPLEAAERKELAAEIALGQPGPAQEPSAPVLLALPARRDIFLAGSGLVLVGCGPGGLRGQALAAAHQPPPWQFRGAAGHSHGHAGCGAALGRSALVPEISAGAGCCRGSGSVPTCPSWPGRNWLANWPPEESLPELLCHKYGNFVVASAILHAPSDAVRAWWLDCALPPEQMRSFWSTWCWWQCQGQKSDPVGTPPLCKAAYKIIWLSLRQLAETELSHFVQSWLLKACPRLRGSAGDASEPLR